VLKDQLHGFVPAVVTPFDAGGAIQGDAFAALVDWLIGNGASAVCVAGDNGESWTLDVAERAALTRLAVQAARGRVPILAGASAPTGKQSMTYARAVAEAGAAALLLLPPTYVLKGTRAEVVRHYEQVARAVPLPIVVYNSPRRAGFSLSLDDLEAIGQAAPVIGIKESHRDFFHHSELLERFAGRLSVMVGPCHYIFPGLALGARGFIASGPELLGATAGRLVALAAAAPGPEQAALHFALTRIYQLLMATGTWPAALKAALNLIGQPAGLPRDPVLPLSPADQDKLRQLLDQLGLLPGGGGPGRRAGAGRD
jgi:4-hydroxy-tetrahydrodipicolinate synthase